jgi:hypothetical protein
VDATLSKAEGSLLCCFSHATLAILPLPCSLASLFQCELISNGVASRDDVTASDKERAPSRGLGGSREQHFIKVFVSTLQETDLSHCGGNHVGDKERERSRSRAERRTGALCNDIKCQSRGRLLLVNKGDRKVLFTRRSSSSPQQEQEQEQK